MRAPAASCAMVGKWRPTIDERTALTSPSTVVRLRGAGGGSSKVGPAPVPAQHDDEPMATIHKDGAAAPPTLSARQPSMARQMSQRAQVDDADMATLAAPIMTRQLSMGGTRQTRAAPTLSQAEQAKRTADFIKNQLKEDRGMWSTTADGQLRMLFRDMAVADGVMVVDKSGQRLLEETKLYKDLLARVIDAAKAAALVHHARSTVNEAELAQRACARMPPERGARGGRAGARLKPRAHYWSSRAALWRGQAVAVLGGGPGPGPHHRRGGDQRPRGVPREEGRRGGGEERRRGERRRGGEGGGNEETRKRGNEETRKRGNEEGRRGEERRGGQEDRRGAECEAVGNRRVGGGR